MACHQRLSFHMPSVTPRACSRIPLLWDILLLFKRPSTSTQQPFRALMLMANTQKIFPVPMTSQQPPCVHHCSELGVAEFYFRRLVLYYSFSCQFLLSQKKGNILLFSIRVSIIDYVLGKFFGLFRNGLCSHSVNYS